MTNANNNSPVFVLTSQYEPDDDGNVLDGVCYVAVFTMVEAAKKHAQVSHLGSARHSVLSWRDSDMMSNCIEARADGLMWLINTLVPDADIIKS